MLTAGVGADGELHTAAGQAPVQLGALADDQVHDGVAAGAGRLRTRRWDCRWVNRCHEEPAHGHAHSIQQGTAWFIAGTYDI